MKLHGSSFLVREGLAGKNHLYALSPLQQIFTACLLRAGAPFYFTDQDKQRFLPRGTSIPLTKAILNPELNK